MKRCSVVILLLFLLNVPLFAQSGGLTAEQEEKIKRLSSDVETLLADNASLRKKISDLSDEVARLRQEQNKPGADAALTSVREDMRKLAEKIQEVDRKRIDDSKTVSEELTRIEKGLKGIAANASRPTPRPTKPDPEPSAPNGPVGEYEVKSGDSLLKILTMANARFKDEGRKSITLKQIQDANPGLNPDKLRAGQKIYIPIPEK